MSGTRLKDLDTRAPKDMVKEKIKEETGKILDELNELQNLLYAQGKHSVLLVLQGMDASGKDGVVRNVMGHMNPQGVAVRAFKTPTPEELSHDFLWRIHQHVPARGMIQVFNRSHYEDVLITRVHQWIDDDMAKKRMKAINQFEKLLTEHNDTHIVKCYLHLSKEKQAEKLKERMEDPTKMWKYNENDQKESELWDDYRKAYEECIDYCNEPEWIIVPSDQNWYKEYLVAVTLRDLLKGLDMKYPLRKL